jgi:hypothetical protein
MNHQARKKLSQGQAGIVQSAKVNSQIELAKVPLYQAERPCWRQVGYGVPPVGFAVVARPC